MAGPEQKFRDKELIVDVWNNTGTRADGTTFSFNTLSIQRSYKDKNEDWKNTNSLRPNDIPRIITLLQEAQTYLETKKPEE